MLTDASVRNASTGMHWDDNPKGFGLRVGKSAKTFIVLLGSGKRHKIGRYPQTSLSQARRMAQELLARRILNPHRPTGDIPFSEAVTQFLDASRAKHRKATTDYYEIGLRHFTFSRLADITRVKVRDAKPPSYALISLKVFFAWAMKVGLTETDPTFRMPPETRYKPRERVMTPKELSTIIQHVTGCLDPHSRIVHLLILTGQRRNEIAQMEWSWIDADALRITTPAKVAKNHREHTYPITPTTLAIIQSVITTSPYVFPAARDRKKGQPSTVFAGWSKAKAQLDERLKIDPWTLHDLRRTFSTMHAALGTPIHVTERLLNHVSGTVSGVGAVYNRHLYLAEMRTAMDVYDKHLSELHQNC